MIIIINGPPGIGKSTIAQKLSKKLKKAAVIEVDRIKYFSVDERKTTDALDIADQQIVLMVKALKETKSHIILEYVYDSPKYFQAVVKHLRGLDRNVFAYRLRSSLRENVGRDNRRPKNIRLGKRVHELQQRLDECGDTLGYTVETTGLSVEKTADKVYRLIGAEIGRM